MIHTTYFAQLRNLPEHIVPISIARSTPKWFTGLECKKLAPTWEILSEWKNSEVKGKREEERYINAFKSDVLSKLNPLDVVRELIDLAQSKDIALVCYEKRGDFCHRHIVGRWLTDGGFSCSEYNFE